MESARHNTITDMLRSPHANAFSQKYQIEEILGEGCSGVVYAGRMRKNQNELVTIKFVHAPIFSNSIDVRHPDEVSCMHLVKHIPGCIRQLDYMLIKDWYIIVMEWLPYTTDLDKYVFVLNNGTLPEQKARRIFHQLVMIIIEMQKAGIIHGDIKPGNVLINTQTGEIKLIDFGGSYMSHQNDQLQIPSSVPRALYQLSFTLCDILHGRESCHSISEGKSKLRHDLSAEVKDLLQTLLFSQDKPTLEQILQHPWLQVEE